jgi:hypothetical protein
MIHGLEYECDSSNTDHALYKNNTERRVLLILSSWHCMSSLGSPYACYLSRSIDAKSQGKVHLLFTVYLYSTTYVRTLSGPYVHNCKHVYIYINK